VKDILVNFLKSYEEAFGAVNSQSMLQRMRYIEECGTPFAGTCLKDLPIKGGDGGFWHCKHAEKASVMELINRAFLSPSSCVTAAGKGVVAELDHIHRVALFGDDGFSLTSIITQSDIVRFLHENVAKCGPIATATAEELGWVGRTVITVAPELPALDALKVMAEAKISAVGVEKNGRLIGNFSMSDMRSITADHFCSLALPVGEFLALEHGTEYAGYTIPPAEDVPKESAQQFARNISRRVSIPGSDVGQELILCEPGWTFAQVLDVLVKNRIHRVYVVESCQTGGPLMGVVTISDVLKAVSKRCG